MAMKGNRATALTFVEKCKSILASNWRGYLNTIQVDSKGSKDGIYTSKVRYVIKRGKPYIWVPEKDMHNLNTVIDERGSLAVSSPFPGRVGSLLKAMKKLPTRIALTGDVVPLKNEKIQSAINNLKDIIESEGRADSESKYSVQGVLRSATRPSSSRSENLKELVDGSENYVIYKFKPNSCMFIDSYGKTHDVDIKDLEKTKADPLATLSAKLIDGINQSETRRRALILFCLVYLNVHAKDAYVLGVDRKGLDLLAQVNAGEVTGEYVWREFRFTFKDEARDVECFCAQLVQMEEEVVETVSSFGGLN